MNKNILYLSYDGMTDPLGQSQVIPYLAGLAAKGYQISIISAEKEVNYATGKDTIAALLKQHNILWHPIKYTKSPPILSTLIDIQKFKAEVKNLSRTQKIHLVHCRSYITAFVGLWLKRKHQVPFLFDMRGFWADERVDGNIWKLKNPLYRLIYGFFKSKECIFLQESDAVVSLTQAGIDEMSTWKSLEHIKNKTSIIPCCADFSHFDYHKVDAKKLDVWREKLKLTHKPYVLSYLGSIGTWYLMDEMLDFFKELLVQKPKAVFLFITKDNPDSILKAAKTKGIHSSQIRITSATRNEVPELALLSTASLFFIKPAYSKKASSPTKMAELMGLGVPLVANKNVGDVELVMQQNPNGVLLEDFNQQAYQKAVQQLLQLNGEQKMECRKLAMENFSLDEGIATFENIYKKLT